MADNSYFLKNYFQINDVLLKYRTYVDRMKH